MKRQVGRAFRPGVAYRDGKLYQFDKLGVTVIRLWPEPAGWRRTRTRGWRHCWPEINQEQGRGEYWDEEIASLEDESDACEAGSDRGIDAASLARLKRGLSWARECYTAAYGVVPAEVREVVGLIRPPLQFAMLSLLARCDGALDLARSNPALALGLAANPLLHRPAVQRLWKAARALVRRRRRGICGWLGFPPPERAVSALSKVPAGEAGIGLLLYLSGSTGAEAVSDG